MHSTHGIAGGQLDQIGTFAAVAEHGGFVAAAPVLGKDTSVLSRRVEALERRLGVRLFTRTTRKVGLTEVGAAYLQRVRIILAELAAADAEATEGAARPRGVLRRHHAENLCAAVDRSLASRLSPRAPGDRDRTGTG